MMKHSLLPLLLALPFAGASTAQEAVQRAPQEAATTLARVRAMFQTADLGFLHLHAS